MFLYFHFIIQSALDIPQQTLVNMDVQVFNIREEEAKQLRDKNTHTK
jgi:hypothetical protein